MINPLIMLESEYLSILDNWSICLVADENYERHFSFFPDSSLI